MESAALPFVDEHHVVVRAPVATVWTQLRSAVLRRPDLDRRLAATLLGAQPKRSTGVELARGTTVPGFVVAESVPGTRLTLTGHHRFSRYALVFTLNETDGTTRLSARTNAAFPGARGRVYRALVIGSRAHRVLLNRLLHGIRRAAEQHG
jgi:hypothetical protein